MRQRRKKGKSIFQFIYISLLIVLLVELCFLIGSLYMGKVGSQLNKNAVDILKKQVENRQNYLQSTLEANQNLSSLETRINTETTALLKAENITIDELVNTEIYNTRLLEAISDKLISTMRNRLVNGIFVALNTQDLDTREVDSYMPGVYLRDQDPVTAPSERNNDLMLERSPIKLVKSLGIATDKGWIPAIKYKGYKENGIVYPVFQAAYRDSEKLDPMDYGHWTAKPYILENDDHSVIAYSIPLILEDGTVYGVVGVEMMTSFLQNMIPYEELQNNDVGAYMLVETTDLLSDDRMSVNIVDISSKTDEYADFSKKKLEMGRVGKNVYEANIMDEKFMASVYPLNLYNKNAPFSNEQWLLVGIVKNEELFALTTHIMFLLKLTIFVTLGCGLLGCYFISRRLARPVAKLSDEIAAAQGNGDTIPDFSTTGIRELDQFATAITELNRDIVNTSTKFLQIMKMASVELGGYELRFDRGTVFYTENFFSLLGIPESADNSMNIDKFRIIMKDYTEKNLYREGKNNTKIYCCRTPEKGVRYIRMEVQNNEWAQTGLIEDVTIMMTERLRIERERDFDALTGLYNRRAFKRECEMILNRKDLVGHAAFVMMDLDNLKKMNDTYGHDWGDEYIRQAGRCLEEGTPKGTLCAHISGDEFNILFYGHESQEEIREAIHELQEIIASKIIYLPDGQEFHLSISGGVAWCPEDSNSLGVLLKYSDFAMYEVKRTGKGRIAEFDKAAYEEKFRDNQIRKEFHQFINEELVTYYFQPLFSARTGKAKAYEALMRANLPFLNNPEMVMRIAREEGALYEIERMTMFKAVESFTELRNRRIVDKDALLFVNSIANQHMSLEDEMEFNAHFGKFLKQLVLEITEEESLDYDALEHKKKAPGFGGAFALDDYGSGYNNEKNLLELAPKYIKVDISIIRDIDTDPDKQQLVENIVTYAHRRDMKIVAEGLETPEELRKVLELGVDLLQGFYLAKPEAVPGKISEEALEVIRGRRLWL